MSALETGPALARVRAAAEGDVPPEDAPTELARVVRRHKPSIYATCLHILRDAAAAIEVTREVVRELYRRLPELSAWRGRARTWIFRLTVRRAYERVRRRGELLVEDGVLPAQSAAARRLAALAADERRWVVARAVAGLDPPLQRAAWLRYLENLPCEVIDAVLGSGASAAAVRRAGPRLAVALEIELI